MSIKKIFVHMNMCIQLTPVISIPEIRIVYSL